jgi:hypothetical protein
MQALEIVELRLVLEQEVVLTVRTNNLPYLSTYIV